MVSLSSSSVEAKERGEEERQEEEEVKEMKELDLLRVRRSNANFFFEDRSSLFKVCSYTRE